MKCAMALLNANCRLSSGELEEMIPRLPRRHRALGQSSPVGAGGGSIHCPVSAGTGAAEFRIESGIVKPAIKGRFRFTMGGKPKK